MREALKDALWQENICPLCKRMFRVTPWDDVFIPACGCYDETPTGALPCESCGMNHVYACQDLGEAPEQMTTVVVDEEDNPIAQTEGDPRPLLGEFFVEPE